MMPNISAADVKDWGALFEYWGRPDLAAAARQPDAAAREAAIQQAVAAPTYAPSPHTAVEAVQAAKTPYVPPPSPGTPTPPTTPPAPPPEPIPSPKLPGVYVGTKPATLEDAAQALTTGKTVAFQGEQGKSHKSEVLAAAQVLRDVKAGTRSIMGNYAFASNPVPGMEEEYKFAREQWQQTKSAVEKAYDKAVSDLKEGEQLTKTKEEFIEDAKKEFSNQKVGTLKPDIRVLTKHKLAQDALKPFTDKQGNIDTIAAVKKLGAKNATKYFNDIGIENTDKVIADALNYQKVQKKYTSYYIGEDNIDLSKIATDIKDKPIANLKAVISDIEQLGFKGAGTALLKEISDQKAFDRQNIKLDNGEYINKDEFNKLNTSDQKYLQKFGIDAFNGRIQQQERQRQNILNKYEVKEDGKVVGYDLNKLINEQREKGVKDKDISKLITDLGFPAESAVIYSADVDKMIQGDIERFIRGEYSYGEQTTPRWDYVHPELASYYQREKLTAGEISLRVGELFVPGLYAARHWNEMPNWEKGITVALDVAMIGLWAKPASTAVRATTTLARAEAASLQKNLTNLSNAVKANNANKVRRIGQQLEKLGEKIKTAEGGVITQRGKQIQLQAETITKVPKNVIKTVHQNVERQLTRLSMEQRGSIGMPSPRYKPTPRRAGPASTSPKEIKVMGPDDVGMTQKQFEQFIKDRAKNPALSTEEFKKQEIKKMLEEVAEAGSEKRIADAIRHYTARKTSPLRPPEPTISKEQARIIARKQKVEILKKWAKELEKEQTPASREYREYLRQVIKREEKLLPRESKRLAADIVKKAQENEAKIKAAAEKAIGEIEGMLSKTANARIAAYIESMTTTDLIASLAINARVITKALAKLDEQKRSKVLAKLSPKLRDQIIQTLEHNAGTKAQSRAVAKTQLMAKTLAATLTATKTQAETKTMTKAIAKAKSQSLAEVKAAQALKIEPLSKTAPEVMPVTKTATKTATKTTIKITQDTTPKKTPKKNKRKPRLPIPMLDGSKPEKIGSLKDQTGTLWWRQGFCWRGIAPDGSTLYSRTPPPGAKRVRGTPKVTLYTRGGQPNSERNMSMGVFDVKVRQGKKITFTRRTKGSRGKRGKLLV